MKKIKRKTSSRPAVAIEILTKRCPFTTRALGKFVRDVLGLIHKNDYGVNVFVVGSRRMKALHWKYFKDHSDTDCISFSQFEGLRMGRAKMLGDVFVCWDQVKRQAGKFGNTPQAELLYCIIHGILHLIGHEDVKELARTRMFRLQDKIFKRIQHGDTKN